MSDVETFKETFPMHTTIEFSTDTRTQFTELLNKFNMTDNLLKLAMSVDFSGSEEWSATMQYLADLVKPEFHFQTVNRVREETFITQTHNSNVQTNLLEVKNIITTKQNKVLSINNMLKTSTAWTSWSRPPDLPAGCT